MRLFAAGLLLVGLLWAAAGGPWIAGPPVFLPGPAGSFDETAVKDPSIVFFEGRWHLFYTARGRNRYTLGYASAASLEGLNAAPRHPLTQLTGAKEIYAAAPQVFYFRSRKLWFLIYQTTDANYLPVYSTTPTIDKPESWTPPRPLAAHPEGAKWIDFWVLCDDRNAYLYFTRDHREVVAMTTSIEKFPEGFRDPRVVFAPLHESAHVYRLRGAAQGYQMLYEIEDGGMRKFARATAPAPLGPWAVDSRDWATGAEVSFAPGVTPWTAEVSHGELLRDGYDERLEAAPDAAFLIQGLPPGAHSGEYPNLPWRLGLLRRRQ